MKVERTVPGAQAPEREALLALLEGPNIREKGCATRRPIPAETHLGEFSSPNGAAAVDLINAIDDDGILRTAATDDIEARQRQLMLKQIVYTLTESPDIDNVEVRLNGESLPLGSQFPGTTLTRRLFDNASVRGAARPDALRRQPGADRQGQGPARHRGDRRRQLRQLQGRDEREARQDHRPALAGQPAAAVAGRRRAVQPADRERHRSVRAVRRQDRDPWGVAGTLQFRLTLQPDGADEKPRTVSDDLVVRGG